jgi:hypothetical protein
VTTIPGRSRADIWLARLPPPHVVFLLAVAALLAGVSVARGAYDADYFWHLETGRLIAREGIPTTDPFSFTYGGPWTTHEWLGQLLLAALVDGLGEAAALAVFGLFPGAAIAVLGFALGRRGVGTLAIVLAGTLAALVMVPYVTARPQAISWLFIALLVATLMTLRAEHGWRLLLLAAPFALWANIHGLYVVGLGLFFLYVAYTVLGRAPMSSRRWPLAAAFGLAVLASALTPAGLPGLLYPLRYVDAGDWGLANIQEWQSPDFHEPAHLPLLALIVGLAALGRRGVPGWLAAFAYLGVAMALLALRNAPIAALLTLPALAAGLDAALPGRRRAPRRDVAASVQLARRGMEIGLALAIVIAGVAVLAGHSASVRADLSAGFPVRGVAELRERDADARVLAEYGWGGFVISQLHADGARVFVDGRNDMYPEQVLEDYSAIRAADSGWEALLDRYGVDAILLPADVTLVRGPAVSAGWCEVYRDELQVLLLARDACA